MYQHAKGGGNKRQTRIRGVEGSREDLARDLCAALKVEEADIRVEGLGGLIVIKVCGFLLLGPEGGMRRGGGGQGRREGKGGGEWCEN